MLGNCSELVIFLREQCIEKKIKNVMYDFQGRLETGTHAEKNLQFLYTILSRWCCCVSYKYRVQPVIRRCIRSTVKKPR